MASVHDVWRLLHSECLDARDLRSPVSIAAIVVQLVGTAILATTTVRAFDDEWVERSLLAWVALDLATHLRMDAWGLLVLATHAVAFALVAATLRERRRELSHETDDRIALSLGVLLFAMGGVAWAPEIVDGGLGLACLALLLPLSVSGAALWRLRARRAWLARLHTGPGEGGWRLHPPGEALAEGLFPLAGYEGECDAVLATHTPGGGAYREVSAPVALVATHGRLRPLVAPSFAALGAVVLALPFLDGGVIALADRAEPFPPMMTQTTFEIRSAGAEPRQPLRYALHVGRCEHGVSDADETRSTRLDLALENPHLKLPRSHVDSTIIPLRVLSNGNVLTRYTASTLRVLSGADVSEDVKARAKENLEQRNGTEIESEMTARGETVGSRLLAAQGMDREDVQEVQQLRIARRGMGAPFPDVPLGEGACWTAVRTTTEEGITSVGTYEYTLTHLDGPRVTLEKTFHIKASSDTPGVMLAPEERFKLRALEVTGKATETIDLEGLNPISEVTDTEESLSADGRPDSFGVSGAPHEISSKMTRHIVRMPATGGED
jgi:hypothetical protein